MEVHEECPVCFKVSPMHRDPSYLQGSVKVECAQCGPYTISDLANSDLKRSSVDRGFVSGTLRRQSDSGMRVILDTKELARIEHLTQPGFKERLEAYLVQAVRIAPHLNDQFDCCRSDLIAHAYCANRDELDVIIEFLRDQGLIHFASVGPNVGARVRLTAKGRMETDDLRAKRANSSIGFIAMWFDEGMQIARRDGLEVGIRRAGYQPHRVDDEHHIDAIDDRIIADIRRCKFLVADLTGHRNGVYYEAGFARGLEKPVFYTCRDDDKDKIHFDIRQFNCIMWKDPTDLAQLLGDRIEAVLGLGPITA